MMLNVKWLPVAWLLLSGSASAAGWPTLDKNTDNYGCDTSAGSRWCETIQQCIQPWVRACPTVNTDFLPEERHDIFGCDISRGYRFCPHTGQCYLPWNGGCPSDRKNDFEYTRCLRRCGLRKGRSCPAVLK